MTKVTLAILLGAACASAWWAFEKWGADGMPIVFPLILSALVFGAIFQESIEVDK